jgi:hypothetical protein
LLAVVEEHLVKVVEVVLVDIEQDQHPFLAHHQFLFKLVLVAAVQLSQDLKELLHILEHLLLLLVVDMAKVMIQHQLDHQLPVLVLEVLEVLVVEVLVVETVQVVQMI